MVQYIAKPLPNCSRWLPANEIWIDRMTTSRSAGLCWNNNGSIKGFGLWVATRRIDAEETLRLQETLEPISRQQRPLITKVIAGRTCVKHNGVWIGIE